MGAERVRKSFAAHNHCFTLVAQVPPTPQFAIGHLALQVGKIIEIHNKAISSFMRNR